MSMNMNLDEQLNIFKLMYNSIEILDMDSKKAYVLCTGNSKKHLILLQDNKEFIQISSNVIELINHKTFICFSEDNIVKVIDKKDVKTIYEIDDIMDEHRVIERLGENPEENPFKDDIIVLRIITKSYEAKSLIIENRDKPKIIYYADGEVFKRTTKHGEDIILIMEISKDWKLIKKKVNRQGNVSEIEDDELLIKDDKLTTKV